MMTAFLGYLLPYGQLSFWAGTVISNIFSTCSITLTMCGGSMISNPTIKRFLVFHILLPLIVGSISIVHIFTLHRHGSSYNTLGFHVNNLLSFYPCILFKDILGLIVIVLGYILQIFSSYGLSHPDNILEVNTLSTPFHIVPEWYFLAYYMVLKAIPSKTSGLMIFISWVLSLLVVLEVMNLSLTSSLTSSYNWIYGNLVINCFTLWSIVILFIGAQLPLSLFLSYGRAISSYWYLTLLSHLF